MIALFEDTLASTIALAFFIPLALTRLGIDPAVASSPLITSVADVSCLLICFSIARAVLP